MTTNKQHRAHLLAHVKATKMELEKAENAIPPVPQKDLHDLREAVYWAEREFNEEKKASASLAMTEEKASAIIAGFLSLVRCRSLVRLDFRNYGEREYYLQDRNTIRRQTLAFDNAWREIAWRNKHDLACALIVASRSAFSGRIEYNHERASWSYCAGQ